MNPKRQFFNVLIQGVYPERCSRVFPLFEFQFFPDFPDFPIQFSCRIFRSAGALNRSILLRQTVTGHDVATKVPILRALALNAVIPWWLQQIMA